MITSANTIHRALRHRWTTVGVTVCVVIGPPSRCLSQAPTGVKVGGRTAGSQMIIEVCDHPVCGLGTRAFAVGDIVESVCGLQQFAGQIWHRLTGSLGQLGCCPARNRVEHTVFLELAGDGSQPMTDCDGPITCRRILFGGRTVLCGAQFVRVEEGVPASAVGAHCAPGDSHGDHDRDRENDEQHADGEPSAGQRGTLLDDAVEQVVEPFREAVGQRGLGVDGFCEFTLRRLVGGVAVDVYCRHVTAAG